MHVPLIQQTDNKDNPAENLSVIILVYQVMERDYQILSVVRVKMMSIAVHTQIIQDVFQTQLFAVQNVKMMKFVSKFRQVPEKHPLSDVYQEKNGRIHKKHARVSPSIGQQMKS